MADSTRTDGRNNGSGVEQHRLEESLGFLVNIIARSMRVALEDRLKQFGVSSTQWVVMQGISELVEARQTDLGKRVQLDDATITRQMENLEKSGLIRRAQAVEDRRTQLVRLTPKGKRLLPKLNQVANEINELATKNVRRANTKSLYTDLNRVRTNLLNNGAA